MGSYPCLIAGLPDIGFDDDKVPFSVESFEAELKEVLSSMDFKYVGFINYDVDNINLLRLLNDPEVELLSGGNFDRDFLDKVIEDMKDEERPNKVKVPDFWKKFYSEVFDEDGMPLQLSKPLEDVLAGLYFSAGMKKRNGFLSDWFEFNLNVNNIIVALTARKYGVDLNDVIVGDNKVAKLLRRSTARDFGLSTEIDYFDTVVRIFEETDILEKERKSDRLRWEWIDQRSLYNYFSIEKVLAYLLQLKILQRWASLDKQSGEMKFRGIIDGFKRTVLEANVN